MNLKPDDIPSPDKRRLIEKITAEFRKQCHSQRGGRIEEHIAKAPTIAIDILRALIPVEIEVRSIQGRLPTRAEFLNRFQTIPGSDVVIEQTFDKFDTQPGSLSTLVNIVPGARDSDALIDLKLGSYELIERIGQGGMGCVYKARHIGLRRYVALKTLRAGVFATEEEQKRFMLEAKAVARLDHPGIVPIFEVGQADGQNFYTMALIEGQSLFSKLDGKPTDAIAAAKMTHDIATAMHYAHERGVIHRDLKPANILVDKSGSLKITDFGLARLEDNESGMTHTGQILGTPSFMAPEQALGKPEQIGIQSDVFSIGAVLFWMLTGRPPFRAATALETIQQVIESNPSLSISQRQSIPRDVQTIFMCCLEKEPGRRYLTAQDLANDLDAFLEGRPVSRNPVGLLGQAWRWYWRKPQAAIYTAGMYMVITALFLATWALGCIVLYGLGMRDALPENAPRAVVELVAFTVFCYLPMFFAGLATLRLKAAGVVLGTLIYTQWTIVTGLSLFGFRDAMLWLEIFSSVEESAYARIQLFTLLFILSGGGLLTHGFAVSSLLGLRRKSPS